MLLLFVYLFQWYFCFHIFSYYWLISTFSFWLREVSNISYRIGLVVMNSFIVIQLLSCVQCSLQPHELQNTRFPCPSLSSRVCSNSCPLSQWCHPALSSSATLFSFCLPSFPASGSFPMRQPGSQSIGTSASASVLPMNIQDWFPLALTGWISMLSKGLSRVFSNITVQSINSSVLSFLYGSTLISIYDYWKNHSFD